jgi:hypothetical protein
VTNWRINNDKIVELWALADRTLDALLSWPVEDDGTPIANFPLGKTCLTVERGGIRLPNGLYIRYPDIQSDKGQTIYMSRKGSVNLWGWVVVENVVQALARIIVGEQMLKIRERYPVALTVHDAAVCVVKKAELADALAFVTETMSTAPSWAAGLPVACEAKYGVSYGEC